jgi:hypothetical protein
MSTEQQAVAHEQPQKRGSILSGAFWMLLLSALLFWLPALGPLIAGYVGGKKAGGVIKGLIAGILPALALGAFFLTVGASVNLPVIGAVLGGTATVLILVHSAVLLVGALIGGALT